MLKRAWKVACKIANNERTSGLIMLGFALAGLMLANLPFASPIFEAVSHTQIGIPYTNIHMSISHWVQDGVLTIFFLTVGLDLKHELIAGSLRDPRAAAMPMICAVGGMVVPPILFVGTVTIFSELHAGQEIMRLTSGALPSLEMVRDGWAIPTATDIAFSLAVLALFAKTLPKSLRAFLMTLATVDDLLGIALIAVFFSSLNAWYWFVGVVLCGLVWTMLVRLKRVPWPVVALVGLLAWVMMYQAGVHPTLAGVMVGLLTPAHLVHGEKSLRAERYRQKIQPLSSLFALPVFALFATGVHFETLTWQLFLSPILIAITIALVVGKPLGIMITAWFAKKVIGLRVPDDLRVRDLLPTACACGIGFTVSLLIASLAYSDADLSGEARFGVLVASIIAAAVSGFLLAKQSNHMEEELDDIEE
ncbi:Na+/H+ antiporter NhaA [Gardnerella piotii]|uniref:Na+/H+ antiporter NhaA n=1 Tax=Gardnerella TaxID=2701 RepID=UPI000352905A|nr:Na+/H+ antiporter NhaA [Gardnerella piotii]EPI58211.1 putative Na+/H+ antiporter NhaA [Gardnerella vaginalis JCP8066]RFT22988.1 sodium:proton antiporter [Bifidobacteriaceae bacterium GH022]UQA81167.1 Na+/H+ antiporter NhaA [Gardnerella piotii]